MTRHRFGLSFERAIAELFIVVVGVLIALSADSWLQARRDRADEVDHLIALRADIVESVHLLETANLVQDVQFASLTHLLEGDASRTPKDSVAAWINEGLYSIGGYAPRLSALRDLEMSGELQLIGSPELRRELANLRTALELLDTLQSDFTLSQQGLLDPFLTRETPLAEALVTASELDVDLVNEIDIGWVSPPSRELQNLMVFKLELGQLGRIRRTEVRQRLDRVLALVDARLSALGHADSDG
ncbi:MAG: hypothetical protein ACC682_00190 [Gemmatimonadota bacterium]